MAYDDILPSKDYVPVVTSYSCGSSLGAIKAVVGLNTKQGRVTGFDDAGNLICIGSGEPFQNASGVYYGIQLESSLGDATEQGWPNNSNDVKWGGHDRSTYIYST